MGNGIGKVCLCSTGAGEISCRHENNNNNVSFLSNNPLGNSVCYVRRPDQFSDDDVTTFRSVSSASVSANSSTPPSTTLADSLQHSTTTVLDSSASFESSTSFTSLPMQHASRGSSVGSCNTVWWSPMERGFSSGPVVGGDGGLLSSPFDCGLNEKSSYEYVKKLQRSFSHNGYGFGNKPRKQSLKKILKRVISGSIVKGVVSIRGCKKNNENANATVSGDADLGCVSSLHDVEDDNYLDDDCGGGDLLLMGSSNLQWAQGRAGEDRVHIVISEEHGWVFVGIYDGFNGPDATNYLLDNLFYAVHDEIKGLLCGHQSESMAASVMATESLALEEKVLGLVKGNDGSQVGNRMVNGCSSSFNKENYPNGNDEKLNLGSVSKGVEGVNSRNDSKEVKTRWEWREEHSEKVGLRKGMQLNLSVKDAKSAAAFSHSDVLLALSEALSKTEEAFLKTVNEMISNNPVLAMMGSCVLVMLMKGEDVYLMNVGDSRAVLATQTVNSLQLTMEHSTLVKEEVHRIRKEHPDDPSAVTKGRVKGYLNITRAFGAGFLKQPKQNNAVLETFKVNYIGDSPYINCSPSLHHHRLGPSDKFLILSSDGLYQYFTNEEAVAKVESFITSFPDRDPAQLLIEEALFRAAKKAGMDFHELLDIPQGERRLYHDDISVAIISFEGKIWRSSV